MSKLVWTDEEKKWLDQVDWSKVFLWKRGSDPTWTFKNLIWEIPFPSQRICAAARGYDDTPDYDPRVRKALRDRISKAKRPRKVVKKWSKDPRLALYGPLIKQMFDEVDWSKVDISKSNSLYCPLRVWTGNAGRFDWAADVIMGKGMSYKSYSRVWASADNMQWHPRYDPTLRLLMLEAISLARG